MRKNKRDLNMPMGKLTKIDDFLPAPEKLVLPEPTIRVTLRLNKSSIRFFKEQARKYRTKYQKMIRVLLDKYAEKYRLQH